jgi:uncharacterized protein YecE (DUF72 family)
VFVGTSGWVYRHWRGLFYPPELPAKRWFEYYRTHFDAVEVNNTFYRLPSDAAFDAWRHQGPPGFVYALKASRYITHCRKLNETAGPLERFLERARRLGPHLGPVLYQLPPHWHRDTDRLGQFLDLLPHDVTHVFEFRDPSWYADEVRELLAGAGVGFCIHDLRGADCPRWVTGPVAYLRFHGPTSTAYAGRYGTGRLQKWAAAIEDFRGAGRDVFAFFNNDVGGHAVTDARELQTLLGVVPTPAEA